MSVLQGWLGQVGFGDQTVFRTKVVSSRFQTCDFGINLKKNKPGREAMKAVRAGRFMTRSKKGMINTGGSIPMILTPSEYAFGRLWAGIFHSNSVAGDSTDGLSHTFEESPLSTQGTPTKGETIERFLGGELSAANSAFDTCFVSKVVLTCPEEGPVMCVVDYLGVDEELSVTVQTATYGTDGCFEGYMGDLKIGATIGAVASVPVKDWSLEITTGVKLLHQKGSQSQKLTAVSWGYPGYKISFNKIAEDEFDTIYNYYANETENAVSLNLKHSALSGSAAGSEFEATFNFPRVIWQGETPELSSEDDQNLSMNCSAIRDDTAEYTAKLIIKNDEAGIYTVL